MNFESNELRLFNSELKEVETSPLNHRREGKENLLDIATNAHELIAKDAQLIVNGSWGSGAQLAFSMLSKRMNRRAWLFNTIARLEYKTSMKYAAEVWHSLPKETQEQINLELDEVINDYDNN